MGTDNNESRALALFEDSLEQPSDQRRAWIIAEAGDNTEVRDRALQMLGEDEGKASIIRTGSAAKENNANIKPPEQIGAYKIGELLGQGGMGAVYKAHRVSGDFDHTVAIKIIKPGILSEALRSRFKNERQVLAGFNHPNIARLYDGGETEDGAPYITMEFIEGQSIVDWAKEENLPLNARLDLFKTACGAVSYAHQNLIVHRDLTPSNVLVTKTGDVKLIDFGIAKLHEEDAEDALPQNSLASLTFTPGFAAPERSKGAAANTLSDIYSLGKLLAAMLAGLTIPDDLQAIIDRATAHDPDERFRAVDGLIDDINQFQAGYPVPAFRGGSGYRLNKFVGRNRLGVIASGVAVAALIGALVVTTSLYRSAETARQEATARFNDVRALAKTMMFEVYDQVADIPGASDAKVTLAKAAQEYIEKLENSAAATDEVRLETAQGFIRLATIQGNPTAGALNEIDTARENRRKAEAILLDLHDADPQNTDYIFELQRLWYIETDNAAIADQDQDAAIAAITKAVDLLSHITAEEGQEKRLQIAWLKNRSMKAVIHGFRGENEQASAINAAVLEDGEKLAALYPEDEDVTRQIAILINNAGRQKMNEGDFQGAVDNFSNALEYVKGTLELQPDNATYLRDMAYTYWRRTMAYNALGQGDKALADIEAGLEYMTRLAEEDPGNENHKVFLGYLVNQRTGSLATTGRLEEAEASALEYVDLTRSFAAQFPENQNHTRDVMVSYWTLASVYDLRDPEGKLCPTLAELDRQLAEMEAAGRLDEMTRQQLSNLDGAREKCNTAP